MLDEYRGLYVNGSWTDTNPNGWDVFIRSESGLGVANSLPGMTPHLMGLNEVTHAGGEVLDYQASNGLRGSSVYAIRLVNNTDPFDENNPDNDKLGEMGLGPPSSGTSGQIFTERIRGRTAPNQTSTVLIAYTTGHEIGHGVHLHHCPDHNGLNCYMLEGGGTSSRHHVTQYHSHHLKDYDLKAPSDILQTPLPVPAGHRRFYNTGTGTWSLLGPNELDPITVTPPADDGNSDGTNGENIISSGNIISTNTGSSSYGCDYNAEYDYCTDTGTCTTRTDATAVGMCGHRWCCCAPDTTSTTTPTSPSTSVTSTNTGYSSSYGCDYNSEYDYCTDTGWCTTRSGEFGIGMCGHRWCCCAPAGTETSSTSSSTSVTSTNTGYSSSYGCDYNAEYDYCTDTGWCTELSGEFGIGMCGHRWCCCASNSPYQ